MFQTLIEQITASNAHFEEKIAMIEEVKKIYERMRDKEDND
jgi:hypothetical protein